MDDVLLGVAVPAGGGWCAPSHITCECGAIAWPHDCPLNGQPMGEMLDLTEFEVSRGR